MKRPFIKQKLFSQRSSAKKIHAFSSKSAELPTEFLDQVSVFETLRAYGGGIFWAKEHLTRFENSCKGIGRSPVFKRDELKRWIGTSLKESAYSDAIVRVSVHWKDNLEGRLLLTIKEFSGHPRKWYRDGVRLTTTAVKRWSLRAQDPQSKSSMYMNGVLAELGKGDDPPHEFIFLNEAGYVAEGSVSNLFIVKAKRILTPAVSSGILRGVTRGAVIALAQKSRIPVTETFLTRHDIYGADECFIANTSSEVLPAVQVDGRRIGEGKPGEITKILAQGFKKLVQEEIKKSR